MSGLWRWRHERKGHQIIERPVRPFGWLLRCSCGKSKAVSVR